MYWESVVFIIVYVFAVCFLLAGIRRKLKARIQGRVGPPVLQPFYDFLKLLTKNASLPKNASWVYIYAPVIGLSFAFVAAVITPLAYLGPLAFAGDVIVIFLLLAASSVSLILGGLASSNPYSGIAASRGLILLIGMEVPLALFVSSLYLATGSLDIEGIMEELVHQRILYVYLAPTLVALMVYAIGKTWTNPFSIPNAETEIMEGPMIEYSGGMLAMAELSHFLELYVLVGLLADMLTPLVISDPVFKVASVLAYTVILLVLIVVMSVIDSIFARLRADQALKVLFILPTILSIFSVLSLIIMRWML
ncbi:MAG: hypothetical protein DRJ35_02795 [Thermoprotei archaeon]|nr:MAG: hypothetical protein DRJ35_02795 [Thermoprotei archaeon]